MRLTATRKPRVGEIRHFQTSRPNRPAGNYRVIRILEAGYDDGQKVWDYEAEFIPPTDEEQAEKAAHAAHILSLAKASGNFML